MLYVAIALLSLLTYAVRCQHIVVTADMYLRCHHIVVSADVCCTLLSHCFLWWRMLYVAVTLFSLVTYIVRCHHIFSLLTYAVRCRHIVFSGDVCCTLPSHCFLCWCMLYVAVTLFSLVTYVALCHHIVVFADVFCTLPSQCCICWRMLYISIPMLSLLTYAVRCRHIVVSADVCCILPSRNSKRFEPSGPWRKYFKSRYQTQRPTIFSIWNKTSVSAIGSCVWHPWLTLLWPEDLSCRNSSTFASH
jgi:hypothetical protein